MQPVTTHIDHLTGSWIRACIPSGGDDLIDRAERREANDDKDQSRHYTFYPREPPWLRLCLLWCVRVYSGLISNIHGSTPKARCLLSQLIRFRYAGIAACTKQFGSR